MNRKVRKGTATDAKGPGSVDMRRSESLRLRKIPGSAAFV